MDERYRLPLVVAIAVILVGCSTAPRAASAPSAHPTATLPALPRAAQETLPPLAIDAMRQRDYPGSDLVIERTLSPGSNYQQYVASYQSDGLRILALLTVPNGAKRPRGRPGLVYN